MWKPGTPSHTIYIQDTVSISIIISFASLLFPQITWSVLKCAVLNLYVLDCYLISFTYFCNLSVDCVGGGVCTALTVKLLLLFFVLKPMINNVVGVYPVLNLDSFRWGIAQEWTRIVGPRFGQSANKETWLESWPRPLGAPIRREELALYRRVNRERSTPVGQLQVSREIGYRQFDRSKGFLASGSRSETWVVWLFLTESESSD